MAAVDKIEEKRKPDDFIGHRNRTPAPINPIVNDTFTMGLLFVPVGFDPKDSLVWDCQATICAPESVVNKMFCDKIHKKQHVFLDTLKC